MALSRVFKFLRKKCSRTLTKTYNTKGPAIHCRREEHVSGVRWEVKLGIISLVETGTPIEHLRVFDVRVVSRNLNGIWFLFDISPHDVWSEEFSDNRIYSFKNLLNTNERILMVNKWLRQNWALILEFQTSQDHLFPHKDYYDFYLLQSFFDTTCVSLVVFSYLRSFIYF